MPVKQWLEFREFERFGTHKTKTWKVHNVDNSSELGFVKWHGPWRQYCYFPNSGTVWNKDCMREMATFIEAQMTEWRRARTKKCGACYHDHGIDCPVCGEKVERNHA